MYRPQTAQLASFRDRETDNRTTFYFPVVVRGSRMPGQQPAIVMPANPTNAI